MLDLQKHLSEHFTVGEFVCRDGTYEDMNMRTIEGLEALRAACTAECIRRKIKIPASGASLHINSGYRSPAYNKKIDGASHSQHCLGNAADITCKYLSPAVVANLAEKIPVFKNGGIGRYPGFTHVDCRLGRSRWRG
jgi:hypothetical protein